MLKPLLLEPNVLSTSKPPAGGHCLPKPFLESIIAHTINKLVCYSFDLLAVRQAKGVLRARQLTPLAEFCASTYLVVTFCPFWVLLQTDRQCGLRDV